MSELSGSPSAQGAASGPALLAGTGATTVVIVLTVIAATGFLLSAFLALRQRTLLRRIERVRTTAAKLFRRDDLNLDELPEQLGELDRRIGELMRDLHREQKRTRRPDDAASPDTSAVLIGTLVQLAADARAEAERLAEHHEAFNRLDEVLGIRRYLSAVEAQIRGLEGDRFAAKLQASLETGDGWDAALTSPAILDAYFDTEELRPLIRRLRAIEQILIVAFNRIGFVIVAKRPLSSAGSDVAQRSSDAPRNLALLPTVRRKSESCAVNASLGEAIVVDCFSPGFISPNGKKRPPLFTIYEPAA